jgi:hypothetical protein
VGRDCLGEEKAQYRETVVNGHYLTRLIVMPPDRIAEARLYWKVANCALLGARKTKTTFLNDI